MGSWRSPGLRTTCRDCCNDLASCPPCPPTLPRVSATAHIKRNQRGEVADVEADQLRPKEGARAAEWQELPISTVAEYSPLPAGVPCRPRPPLSCRRKRCSMHRGQPRMIDH